MSISPHTYRFITALALEFCCLGLVLVFRLTHRFYVWIREGIVVGGTALEGHFWFAAHVFF